MFLAYIGQYVVKYILQLCFGTFAPMKYIPIQNVDSVKYLQCDSHNCLLICMCWLHGLCQWLKMWHVYPCTSPIYAIQVELGTFVAGTCMARTCQLLVCYGTCTNVGSELHANTWWWPCDLALQYTFSDTLGLSQPVEKGKHFSVRKL